VIIPADQIINHQLLNPPIIRQSHPTQTPQRTKTNIVISVVVISSKELSGDCVDDCLCILAADEVAACLEAGHFVDTGVDVDVDLVEDWYGIREAKGLDQNRWWWNRDRNRDRDRFTIRNHSKRLDGKRGWRNCSGSALDYQRRRSDEKRRWWWNRSRFAVGDRSKRRIGY
jgi:hypothetical protein